MISRLLRTKLSYKIFMNILGLFKKALTGASDEDNAKNKARMREILMKPFQMVMIINWYIVIPKITIVL